MAKKPRSQRRKKGQSMEDGSAAAASADSHSQHHHKQEVASNGLRVDYMPEEHTIADDSMTNFSAFDDDFSGTTMIDVMDVNNYWFSVSMPYLPSRVETSLTLVFLTLLCYNHSLFYFLHRLSF